MDVQKKIENFLYLAVSFFINLILFTLLSLYLLVKVEIPLMVPPLQVYLEEVKNIEVEELKLAAKVDTAHQKPKSGEGILKREKEKVEASPMETESKVGDIEVPSGVPKDEPSLLQEIEKGIKGRKKEVEKERIRSTDLGDIVAVVSPTGIGISISERAAVYMPPFPRILSDEPLSPLRIRIWVEPSGVVSKTQIVQRSGSPQVDQKLLEFVKNIRFEAIKENVLQTGIITFRFKGG